MRFEGMDISCYDDLFIRKSLDNRLVITGTETYSQYCEFMEKNPSEALALIDSMNITYSEFFRNPLTFSYLEQMVLPVLVNKKENEKGKEIRIWFAACSAGQEVYSLAIILDEIFKNLKSTISCHIFATDINAKELQTARRGVYSLNSLNKITLKRINTYFNCSGDTCSIVPELRKNINFSVYDLFSENSFFPEASIYGNFDLVFCSNLLFYFTPKCQRRILEKLVYSFAPGAYFICGETERAIVNNSNRFREISLYSCIYQKMDGC